MIFDSPTRIKIKSATLHSMTILDSPSKELIWSISDWRLQDKWDTSMNAKSKEVSDILIDSYILTD